MFRFVALFALVSCAFAGSLPDDLDGRIVNGEATTIEKHPYQVSLQKSSGHFCGGSIINEDTIVTAAHCIPGLKASDVKIRAGSTYHKEGGELVAVRTLMAHPGYNSKTNVNDVAIIKLATPIRESSTVRYIKLTEKDPANGSRAVVTGWGTKCFLTCISLPSELQEVTVNIVQWKSCASSSYSYGASILDSMICAYEVDKDACQGDSGGPLVADGVLVGVVSWGNGCARAGYPGVYGDIAATRSWIEEANKTL